jgi:hypothetical protein
MRSGLAISASAVSWAKGVEMRPGEGSRHCEGEGRSNPARWRPCGFRVRNDGRTALLWTLPRLVALLSGLPWVKYIRRAVVKRRMHTGPAVLWLTVHEHRTPDFLRRMFPDRRKSCVAAIKRNDLYIFALCAIPLQIFRNWKTGGDPQSMTPNYLYYN